MIRNRSETPVQRAISTVALWLLAVLGLAGCTGQPLTLVEPDRSTWQVGEEWHWVSWGKQGEWDANRFITNSGALPSYYRVAIAEGNRLTFVADCNRGGGSITLDGHQVHIGVLMMTRAYCGDASLSDQFASGLQSVVKWQIKDEQLVLTDDQDRGWVFEKAKKNP